MTIAEALQIVLDLAKENIIYIEDNREEHERQSKAIDIVENINVTQIGDN